MPCRARPGVGKEALSWAALLTFALTSRASFASDGARVDVEVRGCSDTLAAERLRDAIGVELKNLDVELVAYIEQSHPRVVIACTQQTELIDLRVSTDHGEALREILDANEAGTARFIAIAIAESLASQASAPPPPTPVPPPKPTEEPPPPEPPPPPVPPRAPVHYPVWWWRAAPGARLFGEPGLPSLEGRLGIERVASPKWSLSLDLSGTRGSTALTSGELSATTLSTGLAIHRRANSGRFIALPGVGVRAGVLRWHGSPSNRATTQGLTGFAPWAGPFLDLALGIHATPNVRVEVAAEGGFTPTQVKATENSNVVGSIGELWLSLQLAIAGRL